jgi:hypothetical protein
MIPLRIGLEKRIAAEAGQWAKVIRLAGIKAD